MELVHSSWKDCINELNAQEQESTIVLYNYGAIYIDFTFQLIKMNVPTVQTELHISKNIHF